jgi:hypothetical protein
MSARQLGVFPFFFQTKLSPSDWQFVFKELQQRRDWQRASRVFKYMQRQPLNQPTEHLYTLMMSIFGREGMLDKVRVLCCPPVSLHQRV